MVWFLQSTSKNLREMKSSFWLLFGLITLLEARPQASRFSTPEKLKIEVKTPQVRGCLGAQNGDKVTIHLKVDLFVKENVFSTYGPGKEPKSFELGTEETILALNEGILGMCENEERILTLPPNKGYGYNVS